jgi:hypothetical protein
MRWWVGGVFSATAALQVARLPQPDPTCRTHGRCLHHLVAAMRANEVFLLPGDSNDASDNSKRPKDKNQNQRQYEPHHRAHCAGYFLFFLCGLHALVSRFVFVRQAINLSRTWRK